MKNCSWRKVLQQTLEANQTEVFVHIHMEISCQSYYKQNQSREFNVKPSKIQRKLEHF